MFEEKKRYNLKEMREKTREEIINKLKNFQLRPKVNLHQGNFVPEYYPLQFDDHTLSRNIDAIEYHIRMLNQTKNVLEQLKNTIYPPSVEPPSVEIKYAIQRMENVITLLQNHRAELVYLYLRMMIEKLNTAKKEGQLDICIVEFYHDYFNEEGFVKEYNG